MDPKLGIDNLKKALHVGISLGMTAAQALEDKKISVAEAFQFLPGLMSIPEVVAVAPAIKQEIADLSAEERAELNAYVQETFDISNDKLEAVIEGAVRLVVALLDEIALFKSLSA